MTLLAKSNASISGAKPIAVIKRAYLTACICVMTFFVSSGAFAAGTDTGQSSMNSIHAWLMEWIPLAAALLIIASALAWIAHMIQASFAVRTVIGLIVIGSASYLVGLFGIA